MTFEGQELVLCEWNDTYFGVQDFDCIFDIADVINNNGAMETLNLASNNLGADGAKHIAEVVKVHVSALRFD